ncbi:hypothetical protein [Chromobacterium violaceum]|uniref:hypothetical protein n=1 Tax=Chromobacterium violaceum TaxID=536 RepID=UPI002868DB6E|nr:hypothetical protein [Chromobacterium violaceum]
MPYLWAFKWRVTLALACMVLAKVAAVTVPLYLKDIVDQLSVPATLLAIPVLALTGYGVARLLSGVLGELRDAVFARVIQGGGAKRGAQCVPPSVQAVAALPPGAPHRRHEPRHRARHQGHRLSVELHPCSTSCPRCWKSAW